jgi:hypothetical protein
MSGPTGNTASNTFGKSGRRDASLNLETALKMLPLVQRIIRDILQTEDSLDRLQSEYGRLERQRSTLAWPDRARRYQLQEDITREEKSLQQHLQELEPLGVALLDAGTGQIGFPTIVNDHRAYFSWRPGEDRLLYWHFAGETIRRLIPASWLADEAPPRPARKRRSK